MAAGQYSSVYPGDDGCALFTANAASDTIEYLVVAQSVSSNPNRQAQFRLAGEASVLGPAAAVAAALQAAPPPSPAERFHTFLREAEARRSYAGTPPGAPLEVRVTGAPPQLGEQRAFKVCSSLSCPSALVNTVTGVVKAVGQHVALYVDVTEQNSLTQADYDLLVTTFDQRLYPIDTLAFGTPSDADGNGVVMALMTPAINRLVSREACTTTGFVAGYFFGADLDPLAANDPRSNRGELFYTVVPDPTGVYSCPHTVARIKQLIPQVFVHEMQHMISFKYHVLLPQGSQAQTEVLWLNEALSHYAEELGGRTYLPGDPVTFSAYVTGNIRNTYDYMSRTGDHFLVAIFGNGTLGERGAGWLFIRYLVDQLATDTGMTAWHAVTRELVQTTAQGAANIEARTGMPFENTLARWALSLWVSDLPGFTAPPELRYRSWSFRTTFAPLSPGVFPKPYPLDPTVSSGPDVDLAGTLRSGSGVYGRVLHPPGGGTFTLQLADQDGGRMPASLEARLTVIRVR